MMGRFRSAVRDTWTALFSPRPSFAGRSRRKEVISGLTGSVVIVRSPNPAYFKEAIFLLRDDLPVADETGKRALLEEARRAAADYVAERTPPRAVNLLTHTLSFLLGALVCTVLLVLFG